MANHADKLVAEFLADHPEHADECRYDNEFGAMLSTKGVRLFAAWAESKGYATKEGRAKVIAMMEAFNGRN